jgi:hypothetical protein
MQSPHLITLHPVQTLRARTQANLVDVGSYQYTCFQDYLDFHDEVPTMKRLATSYFRQM